MTAFPKHGEGRVDDHPLPRPNRGRPRPCKKIGQRLCVFMPCHDDTHASLSLTERDGRLLFKCHAGCEQVDLVAEFRRRGRLNSAGPEKAQKQAASLRPSPMSTNPATFSMRSSAMSRSNGARTATAVGYGSSATPAACFIACRSCLMTSRPSGRLSLSRVSAKSPCCAAGTSRRRVILAAVGASGRPNFRNISETPMSFCCPTMTRWAASTSRMLPRLRGRWRQRARARPARSRPQGRCRQLGGGRGNGRPVARAGREQCAGMAQRPDRAVRDRRNPGSRRLRGAGRCGAEISARRVERHFL